MSNALTAPTTTTPTPHATGQTVIVETAYVVSSNTEVTLPASLTWADVVSHFVKWGRLHLSLADGRDLTFELDDPDMVSLDLKRPTTTQILTPDTYEPLAADDD